MSNNDDDLMFGDRLQPAPPPSVNPPPAPAPAPPPPHGLPTYPTSQFIEERYQILRNEHAGLHTIVSEIDRVAEDNREKLNNIISIDTDGFNETSGAIAAVDSGIGVLSGSVNSGFAETNSNVTGVETHLSEVLGERFDSVDDTLSGISGQIDTETTQIDTAISNLHAKVGESTSANVLGKITIEDSIIEAHSRLNSQITAAESGIKEHVTTEVGDAQDYLEGHVTSTVSDAQSGIESFVANKHSATQQFISGQHSGTQSYVSGKVENARSDLRNALGIEGATSTTNNIRAKIEGVDGKVDLVSQTVGTVSGDVSAIKSSVNTIETTVAGTTGIASVVSGIKDEIVHAGTGMQAKLDDLKTSATDISGKVSGVKEVIGNIENGVTIYSMVKDTKGAVASLCEGGAMYNMVSGAKSGIEAANAVLGTTNGGASLYNVVTTICGKASGLEVTASGIENDVSGIKNIVSGISTTATTIVGHTGSISHISQAVDSISTAVGPISTIAGSVSSISTAVGSISNIYSGVTSIGTELSNVKSLIDGATGVAAALVAQDAKITALDSKMVEISSSVNTLSNLVATMLSSAGVHPTDPECRLAQALNGSDVVLTFTLASVGAATPTSIKFWQSGVTTALDSIAYSAGTNEYTCQFTAPAVATRYYATLEYTRADKPEISSILTSNEVEYTP